MDFLKELLAIKLQEQDPDHVAASDLKIDDEVHGQLDKAAEDDDVDSQCFGLEMEDGAVVKVYVKKEDAEAFEEAMAKRLGEDDDIKAAIEELEKDFDIIEVVWPDEDTEEPDEDDSEDGDDEDGEEETDGGDAINDKVQDAIEKEAKQESVSVVRTLGQRFAQKVMEVKWSDEDTGEYASAVAKGNEQDDPEIPDDEQEPDAPKEKAPQGTEASWTIEKDDKGITIANDRFSIELDDDEMMELMNAIADKKIARFKNEHGKVVYVFTPRGSDYLLKTPEYQGGFRLPKKVVDKILA
jgi:hypothetical protein